jgi:uncharacterized protein (TIGR00156 family)
MKLAYPIAALALVALTAHAQSGGFSGPDNRRAVTTAEIAALDDDTSVRLVGYVVESVGDEEYTFRDETGTIVERNRGHADDTRRDCRRSRP